MTKLEEVARALVQKREQDGGPPWDWYTPKQKVGLCEDARAAVEALRKPSEAMTEAGLKGAIAGVGGCWRAMVDAVLAEKP